MDREWALLEAAVVARQAHERIVAKIKSSQEGLAFEGLEKDPELKELRVLTISSRGPSSDF